MGKAMRKRIRPTALVIASAVLAVSMFTATSSSAAACAMETVALKTFHLVLAADKKVYKVGDTATVEVTVTRPAHEDPLGNGIPFDPPQSYPAEDVNVGIGLRVGDVFLFGHSITDAEGKAAVKVKLEPWTPAGPAIADGFAWEVAADTPCLRVEENGYQQRPNIFKVVKV